MDENDAKVEIRYLSLLDFKKKLRTRVSSQRGGGVFERRDDAAQGRLHRASRRAALQHARHLDDGATQGIRLRCFISRVTRSVLERDVPQTLAGVGGIGGVGGCGAMHTFHEMMLPMPPQ